RASDLSGRRGERRFPASSRASSKSSADEAASGTTRSASGALARIAFFVNARGVRRVAVGRKSLRVGYDRRCDVTLCVTASSQPWSRLHLPILFCVKRIRRTGGPRDLF